MVVVHHASSVAGTGVSAVVRIPAGVFDGGVAVFFVLSGFLIYRPFAASRASRQPAPGASAYIVRRLARLIPAYWLALTILWAAGAFDLGRDWWRHYLLLQPYSRQTALGGLVPAWSLSTELAFYALVPLWDRLVRWVSPHATTLVELAGCAALYVGGFVFRGVVSELNPTWRGLSFQWLPANIDLFAIGMAVAVIIARAPVGRWADVMRRVTSNAEILWVAAAVLFAWYALRVGAPDLDRLADPAGAYRDLYWQQRQFVLGIFSLLLLAPLVLGASDDGAVRRTLRLRPALWLGTVSYGLYLWHLPIMEWAADVAGAESITTSGLILPTAGTRAFLYLLVTGLVISCGFAAASWVFVERPMQQAARRWINERT